MKRLMLVAALAVAFPTLGFAHGDHDAAGEETAFGEPGDAKAPSRTVEIVMKEAGGKMLFEPKSVTAAKGEQIRFVLKNEGRLTHEFMLATRAGNDAHEKAMMKNPDMEHDEPNARRVAPGKTDEVLWRFTKAGEFNFACLIPGHRKAGMDGSVAVK